MKLSKTMFVIILAAIVDIAIIASLAFFYFRTTPDKKAIDVVSLPSVPSFENDALANEVGQLVPQGNLPLTPLSDDNKGRSNPFAALD